MLSLLKKIIRPIYYKTKKILYKISYYLYMHFGKHPKIMSNEETIEFIIKHKCCVSRFGDGEIVLALEKWKIGFQELDLNLSKELRESFAIKNSRLLVCLKGLFFDDNPKSLERRFYEYYYYNVYKFFLKRFVDFNYLYGAADFTRFYVPNNFQWTNFNELDKYVILLKKIWNDKDIIFVEGSESKLGIGNDLFDNASSIKRILCPSRDAYLSIDRIKQSIIKHSTEQDLILMALGPTATVLASYIALETNLWAIDIGHIDIVYLWMKNRCKTKMNVSGKHVNEANFNAEVIDIEFDEDQYCSQIIDIIENP